MASRAPVPPLQKSMKVATRILPLPTKRQMEARAEAERLRGADERRIHQDSEPMHSKKALAMWWVAKIVSLSPR